MLPVLKRAAPDGIVMQVRLDRCGTIEREMLLRAMERLETEKVWAVHIERPDETDDPARLLLESLGFVRDEEHYLLMHRTLDSKFAPRPASRLASRLAPDGWEVRHVGAEDEWRRRVELHQEVWNSGRVTLEAYRRLRDTYGYEPSLDLVAVNEAGEFGAYCICWYDPTSRTGLFEPVGTGERFRCAGLGLAIVEEGLARFARLGAQSALVTSAGNNDASRLLYESVGFRTVAVEYLYGVETEVLKANLA